MSHAWGITGLCYAGPCRIHGTEEAGKATLCAGAHRSWRYAWRSERDDLSEFACVPRHLVLVSPFFWIHKHELERGSGARVGQRGLVDHERVDLYALRCGVFAELRRAGAWPFVFVGCDWRRGHVVAEAGRHAGERARMRGEAFGH